MQQERLETLCSVDSCGNNLKLQEQNGFMPSLFLLCTLLTKRALGGWLHQVPTRQILFKLVATPFPPLSLFSFHLFFFHLPFFQVAAAVTQQLWHGWGSDVDLYNINVPLKDYRDETTGEFRHPEVGISGSGSSWAAGVC